MQENFTRSTLPPTNSHGCQRGFWSVHFGDIVLNERRGSLKEVQMLMVVLGPGDLFQKSISEAGPASLGTRPCGRWGKERCTS